MGIGENGLTYKCLRIVVNNEWGVALSKAIQPARFMKRSFVKKLNHKQDYPIS